MVKTQIKHTLAKAKAKKILGFFCCSFKMTMWADNVKFVKDILDSKYQKIDSAVHEVT